MQLDTLGRLARRSLKRFLYSQLAMREAVLIALGKSKPLIRFNVEGTPPSVYFNFRIRPDALAAVEKKARLPTGFSLAKMRCLEGEAPFHALTLNVYRVSGLTNALRAEWSVYVHDASGKARYMIVEARSSQTSMDPIDIITKATVVEHALDGRKVTTRLESDGGWFEATCTLPGEEARVSPAGDWVEANDVIYWHNGIADRTFYDSALARARPLRLSASAVTIRDTTSWAPLVEPTPANVVAFTERFEFVISPWWNL